MTIGVGVLTVSDSASAGQTEDRSGPALVQLARGLWPDVEPVVGLVPDDRERIAGLLREWADSLDLSVVFSTGGTGFAPRDVTPEATRDVIDREAAGLAEAMRAAGLQITPHAMLSRGIAGIRKNTLIINFSGSPKAVREQFAVLAPVLPHALELLRPTSGGVQHARSGEHQRQA